MSEENGSFVNAALIDFSIADERKQFQEALDRIDSRIKAGELTARPIIDGKEIECAENIASIDPSDPDINVGTAQLALEPEVEKALQSLQLGAAEWAAAPCTQRAQVLCKAADAMLEQRRELAALIVREAGKPWQEADGDVIEAIDFCRYYAAEMLRLGVVRETMPVMGEDNTYFYQPRGIAAVISPWNFPFAISCGMLTAALVTGNAAVLKPASQTPLIAYQLVEILLAAGLPPNALAFLPGPGSIIGNMLVESPTVNMICFTGSKEVGLQIISKAAEVRRSQRSIKRVIAELGGKNAIIVDEDADLDEAVKGVIYSAFGYAGQKCSACSRVIGVGSAYEPFLKRFCDAARDVLIGNAADPSTLIGPIIDKTSQERILKTIAAAEAECTPAFKGKAPPHGFFVAPTIFRDVDPQADIWRNEIFGPVVACRQAKNFDEALALANGSDYALTGGLYSRSPANIERAKREFQVGNLYINRGCTGAIVCRQPFGGFRMSGVGSKAGGPDYLLQFMEPRTVSENTMRRGCTPDLM